jgi:hypothetical protein
MIGHDRTALSGVSNTDRNIFNYLLTYSTYCGHIGSPHYIWYFFHILNEKKHSSFYYSSGVMSHAKKDFTSKGFPII